MNAELGVFHFEMGGWEADPCLRPPRRKVIQIERVALDVVAGVMHLSTTCLALSTVV